MSSLVSNLHLQVIEQNACDLALEGSSNRIAKTNQNLNLEVPGKQKIILDLFLERWGPEEKTDSSWVNLIFKIFFFYTSRYFPRM